MPSTHPGHRQLVLLALAVAAIALIFPATGRADCGGTQTAPARRHHAGQLPPLALGDSTMLLSLPGLAAHGYDANAHGCREFGQAVTLLDELRTRHALPHMVVIALGANGTVTGTDIDRALGIIGNDRLLVLVTPRELGGGSGADAATERAAAAHDPGRILLLDWVKDSAGHPDWFAPDGLHLNTPGVNAFTALLNRALPYAYVPCPPNLATEAAAGAVGKPVALRRVGAAGSLRVRARVSRRGYLRTDARRLVATIDPHARAGHTIVIRLRDRSTIGAVRFTICVAPPGARSKCTRWYMRPGQSRRVIQIPSPRPGGWLIAVHGDPGATQQTRVWVTPVGSHLRLLAAGDSEMQILDDFIGQDVSRYGVQVTSDARISTGLTNSFFFDWPAHARQQAPALAPDVTVIFMGANDGFSVAGAHGQPVGCCSAAWSAGYADRVAEMMRIYLRNNAGRVYWFLLPTPRPGNFQRLFDAVNAGIREAAERFPGRVSLIDANAFFTPGNRYRDFMTYHGRGFTIHEPDGIHLSTASDTVAAALVTQRLLADHIIR